MLRLEVGANATSPVAVRCEAVSQDHEGAPMAEAAEAELVVLRECPNNSWILYHYTVQRMTTGLRRD